MNRRKFCSTALSAAVMAACPMLPGARADTGIRAISLDGREIELERAAIRELDAAMNGTVLLSGHPAYDGARKVWNGMHDRRPALIARCRDSGDIAEAVTFARERNLLLSVRGGGHSWPGKSVCDDGLMLDLAEMRSVSVDPTARRAVAEGGALLGQLDDAALEYGLVTTAGVVSHTGVGGYTLGGGFGRLNRKYGLTIDNLKSAEIVTADGRTRRASRDEEPDLFWAIRGGGGNFGVVSRFEYELHPFDRNVLSGLIAWPVSQARDVLEFYAEWSSGLSRELYVGPAMMTLPDGSSIVAMEVVYNGNPVAGEKELAPLRSLGSPLDDGIGLQDYKVMQTWEDATFAHGVRSYAKNGMVKEFTQELVDTMLDSFVADSRMAVFTHTAGGAVRDTGEAETAFPHRNAETMIIVAGNWSDPNHDEEAMALGRRWFADLEPHTGGYYDNIEWDGDKTVTRNYGPNYARLSKIKGRYDPVNLFRMNSNILPA